MPPFSRRLFSAVLIGFACASAPSVARAQAEPALPKKELSATASAGFAKIQPLIEAKDYAGALALIEAQLAAAPGKSYEAFVLSRARAQLLLMQNRLAEAIAPIERAHALAEANPNFFDLPSALERLYLLAQLHYQVGAEQKTPAAQRAGYQKSLAYIQTWLKRSPKPTSEVHHFAASLLYSLATLDSARVDQARLREAISHAREALVLSARPDRQVRLILAACQQALGDNAGAAEQLELLADADPKNASVWSQLQALYLTAAEGAHDPAELRAANLRALLTLERAQASGFLSSPKDNYTRIAILFNLGQFTRAAERMEKGLADGSLEGTRRNWELLASAYQQSDRESRALDALGRAVEKFPADGALEFSLAQSLYNAGRVGEAYDRGRSALRKTGVEKPGQARLYLAFLAHELQRFDEARDWIEQARESGDVPAASAEPLRRAIEEALAQREALKKS